MRRETSQFRFKGLDGFQMPKKSCLRVTEVGFILPSKIIVVPRSMSLLHPALNSKSMYCVIYAIQLTMNHIFQIL